MEANKGTLLVGCEDLREGIGDISGKGENEISPQIFVRPLFIVCNTVTDKALFLKKQTFLYND